MLRRVAIWVALLVVVLLASACTPWVRQEQSQRASTTPLEPGNTLGQTFTARENGLQAIEFYLAPLTAGQGAIQLALSVNAPQTADVLTSTIPLANIQQPGWYRFDFSPIDGSSRRDYYAELSLTGSGSYSLGIDGADSYLDGSLYRDGQPADAQAAFQLVYDPSLAADGIASQAASWVLYLLAAFWLLVIPGWGLLSNLYPGWSTLAWIEKIALSAGLSLPLYPLLFLWTSLAGLRLAVAYTWLPGLFGIALIAYHQHRLYRSGKFSFSIRYQRQHLLPDIMLLFVLVLLVFSRLWVIRQLDFPMWGDSYQHTMIAQLLVDNGGLFNNWLPYARLGTFTYHFGFHTLAAVFHWVTGLALPVSILWAGQIVNLLAIVSLIPLANRLGGSRWAGVLAVVVAGLLSPMPQAYLNWGRYTQLAGQAILPVIVVLSFTYLGRRSTSRGLVALLALALGGLALTHYRILIFSVLFYIAYLILKAPRVGLWSLVLKITWIGLGAIALSLPWLIHIFSGGIPAIATAQLSTPVTQLSTFAQQYNSIGNIGAYLSPVLWLLMLIAAGWGLWRRDVDTMVFSSWWLLILLAANPQWLHLPGSGIISNFAVIIAAYIPAAVLIGAAAGWITRLHPFPTRPQIKSNTLIQLALVVVVLLCSFYGVRSRLKDINPQGAALFTRADDRAARWIDSNLPRSASFLVNAFFAYADWVTVGSDGGWWLPLTAHRQTSLPPINYGNEKGIESDYRQQVNLLQSQIIAKGIDHPDVLRLLAERGIRYIYIGQRQGRVNNASPVLDPQVLLANPLFKPIYHQDRVYIFEVLQ